MTLGIVLNAGAGSGRWAAPTLRQHLGAFAVVAETASVAEISVALAGLRDRDISVLVPFGGDGTVSRVLAAAVPIWGDELPPVFLVRAGTINMIANSLGMGSKRPLRGLKKLAAACHAGKSLPSVSRRTMCTDTGAVGFTFGFGAPVKFLEIYDGAGALSAIRVITRAALSLPLRRGLAARLFEPVALRWQADGQGWQQTTLRVFLAMTIDELSLSFRVAPGAGEDREAMHTIYGDLSPGFVVRNLRRFHDGHPVSGPDLHRARLSQVNLCFDDPTAWMMDGEIHPPVKTLSLKLGPQVRFICPIK